MSSEILGIAAQSIAAQELALQVTGNNMANATTPGYNVESVDLTENAAAPNASMPSTLIGDGVTVTAVTRASNTFLSSSVRNQTSAVGYATALSQGLNQVQSIFQEPQSGGLAEMMDQFSQSILALSESPEDQSARESVIQDGQTLASTFNSMSSTLANEETQINQNISTNVSQINQYASQISQLNQQIATVSTSGQQPNDLLDQRGELLDELSQLTNVSYTTGSADSLDVYIGSHPLVTGETTYQINVQQVPVTNASGVSTLTANEPTWADTGSPVESQSGSLAGNIALLYQQTTSGSSVVSTSPGYLTSYGQSLDSLASQLAQQVNTAQESGYTLSGSAAGTTPFFTAGGSSGSGTITAGTITVNPALTPDDIAAGSTANSPGDGSNAQSLYNTLTNDSNLTIGSSSNTSFSGYYESLVGQVGLDGQNATNSETNGQNTLTSLNNELQSVTGVDVNQQSIDMIQEEQSYEAAAKLITTQQSVISSLLAAVN